MGVITIARPPKTGLDYFPLDVDIFEDEKMQFVSARFGTKGEAITIRLLCKIYKNGYYFEWNKDAALLLAKDVGGDKGQDFCVRDVVYELIKRGFFDKDILSTFGVLTSKGIQLRFLQAVKERSVIDINLDYWLIERPKDTKKTKYRFSPGITPLSGGETGLSHGVGTQRIGKESIYPPLTGSPKGEAPPKPKKRFKKPTLDEVQAYCENRKSNIDPAYFIDYYTSKDWMVGKSPMKDWKAAVRNWERRQGQYSSSKANPALQYPQRQYQPEELDELLDEL